MSEIRILISSKIKYYREREGISQEELSVAINRNKDFIKKVESNEYIELPTITDIVLIAKTLNVSVNDLLWFSEIRKIIEEKNIERTAKSDKESRYLCRGL